jgi:hypothetical protein
LERFIMKLAKLPDATPGDFQLFATGALQFAVESKLIEPEQSAALLTRFLEARVASAGAPAVCGGPYNGPAPTLAMQALARAVTPAPEQFAAPEHSPEFQEKCEREAGWDSNP